MYSFRFLLDARQLPFGMVNHLSPELPGALASCIILCPLSRFDCSHFHYSYERDIGVAVFRTIDIMTVPGAGFRTRTCLFESRHIGFPIPNPIPFWSLRIPFGFSSIFAVCRLTPSFQFTLHSPLQSTQQLMCLRADTSLPCLGSFEQKDYSECTSR